jgi:hypothetical protein
MTSCFIVQLKALGVQRDAQSLYLKGKWLDEAGFISWQGQQNVQTSPGAHQLSFSMRSGVISAPIRQPKREFGHLAPSNAVVKNELQLNCSPAPSVALSL